MLLLLRHHYIGCAVFEFSFLEDNILYAYQFIFNPSIEQGENTSNTHAMSSFAMKACRATHISVKTLLKLLMPTGSLSNANLPELYTLS